MSTSINQTKLFLGLVIPIVLVYAGMSLLAVVLPTIQRDLNTTSSSVLWVVNAYILVRSTLTFASGRLSDMFSHQSVFFLGIVILTATSIACAVSPTISLLIAFRCLQAVGATFIFTSGMSLIADLYPKEKRGKAIAKVMSMALVGMMIAPVLGGVVVQYISWRGLFYMYALIGTLALFLQMKRDETRNPIKGSFDWLGFLLLAVFTVLLDITLQNVGSWGWLSLRFLVLFGIGLLALILFLKIERSKKDPIIDLNIFSLLNFPVCSVIASLTQVFLWL